MANDISISAELFVAYSPHVIAGPCGQVVTSSQMVTSSQVVTWQSDDILIVMGWAGESSVQPGTEQGGLITLDRQTTTHHTGPSCQQQQLMLRGPASVVGVPCEPLSVVEAGPVWSL